MLRAFVGRARLLILLSLAAAAVGCDTARSDNAKPAPPPPSTRPACRPAPVSERAARVVVAGLPEVTAPSDPVVRELTGLQVGGVFITDSNVQSVAQVGELVATIRREAGRPLVVATDEESGRVSTFAAALGAGPSRRLATQRSPAEVRELARGLGAQLASIGINVDLAPVVDVDGGPWSGLIGDRSFSGDPAVAARYGLAFAQGLNDARVVPVAKHFPGQGRAGGDTHTALSTVDTPLEELRSTDLVPFEHLVDAGVPVVMLSHAAYTALDPDVPASLSPRAYQLLRDLGFTGVAMTDAVGMGAVNVRWDYEAAAVKAVAAGADALLVTDGKQARRMRDALIAAVQMRELDEARLDEAATRVTVLAGGDPMSLTCRTAILPELTSAPTS